MIASSVVTLAIRKIISSGTSFIRVLPYPYAARSSARILMGSSAHSQITSVIVLIGHSMGG